MRYRTFLLSFTATALLAAPFLLEAEAPPPFAQAKVAPAPGWDSEVGGLKFHSTLVKADKGVAIFKVETRNASETAIDTEVTASLMLHPSVSPMARMVPPPRELSVTAIHLTLAPGERFSRTITVKLPEEVSRQIAEAARAPRGPNAAPDDEMMMIRPPSFFATVRPTPAPAQALAAQVAAN